MTNDIKQLSQGIHNFTMHIYELLLGKGFSIKASRREVVYILCNEIENILADDDAEYILNSIVPLVKKLVKAKIKRLSAAHAGLSEEERKSNKKYFEEGKTMMLLNELLNNIYSEGDN
jgi:hypothetical protein